jgi:DNA-binding transcriptional ArsR family regulator
MDYADAREVARMFAALGDPTRLKIVAILLDGPQHVGELAKIIDIPMVNMSHHLGVMRQAGLLEDEKQGRKVLYKFRGDVFTPARDGDGVIGTLNFGPYRVIILNQPYLKAKAKRKAAAE